MCTTKNAPKLPALRNNPTVALTIEIEVLAPKILLIRGRAELDFVDGIPDEYLQATSTYEMTPEQRDRSSSGTTNCCASPATRWPASIGPSTVSEADGPRAGLGYLPKPVRESWVELAMALPGRWISNEAPIVLTSVSATPCCAPPQRPQFAPALDGQCVGWAHGRGRSLPVVLNADPMSRATSRSPQADRMSLWRNDAPRAVAAEDAAVALDQPRRRRPTSRACAP